MTGAPKAALCGHDLSEDAEVFTDEYDNPESESLLDDQRSKMPNGALGFLKEPELQDVHEVPNELVALWKDWKDKKIGIFESLPRLEAILNRNFAEEPKSLEP